MSPSQSRSDGWCRKVSRLPSSPCGVTSSSQARTWYILVTCHSSGASRFPWLTTSEIPAAACAWRNTHVATVPGLRATVYRVTGNSDLAHPAAISTKAMKHVARGTGNHHGSFWRTGPERSGNDESLVTLQDHHNAGCSGVTPSGPGAEVLGSGYPLHPIGAGAGVRMHPEPWSNASPFAPSAEFRFGNACWLQIVDRLTMNDCDLSRWAPGAVQPRFCHSSTGRRKYGSGAGSRA